MVIIVLIIVFNAPTAVDVARAWSMVAPDTMSMLSQPSISASELERNTFEGRSESSGGVSEGFLLVELFDVIVVVVAMKGARRLEHGT